MTLTLNEAELLILEGQPAKKQILAGSYDAMDVYLVDVSANQWIEAEILDEIGDQQITD